MKKRNSFLLAALVGISSLNVQAQSPTFTLATPDGANKTFRGNIVWGDYNNDGHMDLIYVGRDTSQGWATSVNYYQNDGNGGFTLVPTSIPADGIYNSVFANIDYNNDGLLDLIYMGTTNKEDSSLESDLFIQIYRNTGSGFEMDGTVTGLVPLFPNQEQTYYTIAVGDYNCDGRQDIAITGCVNDESNRFVKLFKNMGNGAFQELATPVDGSPFEGLSNGAITLGDIDNDGDLDLFVSGWSDVEGTGAIRLYRNMGDDQFQDLGITFASNPDKIEKEGGAQKGQIAMVDLDGDGNLDLVYTGETMLLEGWSRVAKVLMNKGCEDMPEEDVFAEDYFTLVNENGLDGTKGGDLDYADLNGDGKMDLIIVGESNEGKATIYLNNGADADMMFEPYYKDEHNMAGARSAAVVTMADYNNDGFLDVALCGYNDKSGEGNGSFFAVYKNNGNLSANAVPTAPKNLTKVISGDKITFSWEAGSDAETPVSALRYNLYVKKGDMVSMLIPADVATGKLKVSNTTNSISSLSYTMTMADAIGLEWGVQTIDQSKAGSAFATENGLSIADEATNNIEVSANNGEIFVKATADAQVSVTNASGIEVANKVVNGKVNARLDKGLYIVNVRSDEGNKIVKVII